ncbi:MAG: hypothetical protein WBK96_02305 [Candidatus Manganitrophaceae bacterium]
MEQFWSKRVRLHGPFLLLSVKPMANHLSNYPFFVRASDAHGDPSGVATFLSTAASRLLLRLRAGWRRQKLFPTGVAAKVERLSIAFGVESSCCVHGHTADGVFGHGFRFFHG